MYDNREVAETECVIVRFLQNSKPHYVVCLLDDTADILINMFNVADVIGPYEITAILGQGGTSTAYKAKRRINETPLALKVLLPELSEDDKAVSAFFNEAIRVEPLQHKHIIQVYNYGSVVATNRRSNSEQVLSAGKHVHYIAMDYAQGGSLKQRLADNSQTGQKLTWREALTICKQIARALEYLHDHDFIHCDVKPSNILCLSQGHYVLSDFGIAQRKDEHLDTVVGTPEYMSPEQCGGSVLDTQSDQYSLGVVLYEMLTGRPPFIASEPEEVLNKHREQAPPPLSQFNTQTPKGVQALVYRTLEKQPNDRFLSIADLIKAIDHQLNVITANMTRWMIVGIVSISLLIVGFWAWQIGSRQDNSNTIAVITSTLVMSTELPPVIVIPGNLATVAITDLPPVQTSTPIPSTTRPEQNTINIAPTSTLAPPITDTPLPLPLPTQPIIPTRITQILLPTQFATFTPVIIPPPTNPPPTNPPPANPPPANPLPECFLKKQKC